MDFLDTRSVALAKQGRITRKGTAPDEFIHQVLALKLFQESSLKCNWGFTNILNRVFQLVFRFVLINDFTSLDGVADS